MKRQISSYKGKKLCLWQKLLLSAVLAGAVTFAGLFGAVLYGSYDHIQGDPRAMVVLGCQVMPDGEPSILLRDRLDRALAGSPPSFCGTGWTGRWTTWRTTRT